MSSAITDAIGGYELYDDGTPFPGGKAFATRDPHTGQDLVLRRYRGEWLAPADSLDLFQNRAQAARRLRHPNLASVIDTGFVGSDVFVVLEPVTGASLESLVKEIGPMPATLAVQFTQQAAAALQAIHEADSLHGDVRPAFLFASPLQETTQNGKPVRCPGPDAKITLMEFGLIPKRPNGREWAALDPLSTKSLGFLPPERTTSPLVTTATDIYGLGATLFFLLTGRAPYVANSAHDMIHAIENSAPAPLGTLRPDLPSSLVDAVNRIMSKQPDARPQTASEAAVLLTNAGDSEPVALTPAPVEWTPAEFSSTSEMAFPTASSGIPMREAARESRTGKPMTAAERSRLKTWLYLGIAFWLISPILWFAVIRGCGDSSNGPGKTEPSKKKTK